ncbi:hypothetical protein NDU88_002363 [Pleurodeles waltl]|uniref:t-SNARE coiled-coil homology domain-containing protein n=1 Tax=Pleurodeles waltl TaxID=8319 RepID=A0AAV7VB18_PLEWA|nr:hypothetical protein NDU88_002363 [Pleurodeles waltl]
MDTPDHSAASPNAENEPELMQIRAAMQKSLATIDEKIDSLFFRMDKMTERLDKQAERLDLAERCVSDMEDDTTMTTNQSNMHRMKVEDLEAWSRRNNLRIMGIAESTSIDNMEKFVKQLLTQLLDCQVFSEMFIVKRVHRSLVACPAPGGTSQTSDSQITKL